MRNWPKPLLWVAWIIIIWGLREATPFLIPLLLASLLSFLMNPLVHFLECKKIPEWLAVSFSSILMFLPVFALASLLLHEGSILLRDYPLLIDAVREHLTKMAQSSLAQNFELAEYFDITSLAQKLSEDAAKTVTTILTGLKAIAEAGVHFFIILFFSVVMLASRKHLRKSAEKLMNSPRTLNDIISLIEKFLIARMGIAVAIGLVDSILLKGFGSRYCVLFGFILGFSTFIPAIGFFLGILPPIIAGIAFNIPNIVLTGMIFTLYAVSSIESHLITPKYLGKQLNLNLFVTFLGLFAGELLWGIWGMALSIPLLGIVRIILAAAPETREWSEAMSEKTEI